MAMKLEIISLCVAASAGATLASADQYSWTQWDLSSFVAGQSVSGSIASSTHGTIGVTFTGDINNIIPNYPSWTPTSTYADGTIVNNAPDSNAIVQLYQNDGTFTLTFSKPVDHVAFSAWSLGAEGYYVAYTFNQQLTIIAGGPSAEYGGQSITGGVTPGGQGVGYVGNSIIGDEGNGTAIFNGPFTKLTWTIQGEEYWHGFEVGLKTVQTAPPTPSPAAVLPFVGGIIAIARRRYRA